MTRKNLAIIYLLFLSIGTLLSLYIPKNEVTANDAVIIPSDAIRLRILANSDSAKDQALKRMVRDEVNKEISQWVSDLTSKEEARKVIKAGLPKIQKIAEQVVSKSHSQQTVKVEFGKVKFPTKLYGQFLYPAGEYEAILITLGEGTGANWWCVLFPPLCFLDFSNGVAVSERIDEEKDAKEKKQKVQLVQKEQQQQQKQEQKVQLQNVKNEPEKRVPVNDQLETGKKEIEKNVTPQAQAKEKPPVYTKEDEQPVEVKFFVVELWDKIFG